jgi:type I site-specific restriction-modification system R (restriction) subunit
MKLPNSWLEVKTYQFKELRALKDAGGFFNIQLETLAILADVSTDELEDLTLEEVGDLFRSVKWVLHEPKKGVCNELLIDGHTYTLQPFKKLTLDEFIDLEHFLENDYLVHISHIASVFWRRTELDKWGNLLFEPYIFSPFDRYELFEEVEITKIYGIVPEYLKFRENFMQKYKGLFNQDEDEPLEVKDFDSIAEYKEHLKAQEQEQKAKKWGYESLIFDLCDGDITKIKAVGELPLILVFNMLAMRKEMGYLETPKG